MRQCLEDFRYKVELMRDSVDLESRVGLEQRAEQVLPVVCGRVSSRVSAFVLSVQGGEAELASGGCRVLEEALLELLCVVQVLRRECPQSSVATRLRAQACSVFEASMRLVNMLIEESEQKKELDSKKHLDNKKKKEEAASGAGVLWRELDKLAKLETSSRAQLCTLLQSAEANVIDTIEEMQELPSVSDDEDEGLDKKELERVAKALIAVKVRFLFVVFFSLKMFERRLVECSSLQQKVCLKVILRKLLLWRRLLLL